MGWKSRGLGAVLRVFRRTSPDISLLLFGAKKKKKQKTPRLRQQLTATGMNDPRIRADLGGAGAAVADSRLP